MPEYEVSRYGGLEHTLRRIGKDRDNIVLKAHKDKYHEKKTTKRKKEKAAAEKRAKKRAEKEAMTQKTLRLSYKIMQARQGKREDLRGSKRRGYKFARKPAAEGAEKPDATATKAS